MCPASRLEPLDRGGLLALEANVATAAAEPASHLRNEPKAEDEEERGEDTDARTCVGAARRDDVAKSVPRRLDTASARPLLVAVDDGVLCKLSAWTRIPGKRTPYLEAVDELGERDVLLVAKDVDRPEVLLGSAVLELETQEVADIRRHRAAQLNREHGSEVG